MFKDKKIGESIMEYFDAKFPREKSGKMEFSEVKPSAMAEGGEAEDDDQMEELASHAEAMHEASKKGDHKGHARALKAFMQAHQAHEERKTEGGEVEDKDVDNGPVSDKKDSKKVSIAGDEYD
jgi:hypothetical protein